MGGTRLYNRLQINGGPGRTVLRAQIGSDRAAIKKRQAGLTLDEQDSSAFHKTATRIYRV
jgi:hypothetical protein